jgi:Mn-containing catalase
MGKAPFSVGKIPPTPVLVDQYFNDSTGEGDEGDTDARGPWNEGGAWQIVEVAELKHGVENLESANGEASGSPKKQRASSPEPKTRRSA